MPETKTDVDNLIEIAKRAPKPRPEPRPIKAYRHPITGHVRFFACDEDEAAYRKHCDGYQAFWSTSGVMEIDVCHRLADTTWRLDTVASMENAIQADTLSLPVVRHCEHEQADVAMEYSRIWKDSGKQLDMLSRYESRLHRNYKELLANLKELQADRRAAEKEKALREQKAANEAALKAQQEASAARLREQCAKLKPAQPDPNFDFSQIDATIAAAAAEYLPSKKLKVNFDFSKKSAPPLRS